MKTMGAPGQQEGAVLSGRGEGGFVKRVVILAHGFACDDTSGENNIGIILVGQPGAIQQRVLASA